MTALAARPLWRRAALVCALLAPVLGCKNKKDETTAPEDDGLALEVLARGDEYSNNGYSLQLVVRAVEEKDFIEDSYAEIAALVATPDESVLDILTVFPGEVTSHVLELEELPASVGVYGLFNDTREGEWKLLVAPTSSVVPSSGKQIYTVDVATDRGTVRDLNTDAE